MENVIEYKYDRIQNRIKSRVKLIGNGNEIEVNALWDTGATNTCISNKIASKLNLIVYGNLAMNTANGETIANVYIVDFSIESKILFKNNVVFSANLNNQDVDMLIGMDIIQLGNMRLINENNRTCFVFEKN